MTLNATFRIRSTVIDFPKIKGDTHNSGTQLTPKIGQLSDYYWLRF